MNLSVQDFLKKFAKNRQYWNGWGRTKSGQAFATNVKKRGSSKKKTTRKKR